MKQKKKFKSVVLPYRQYVVVSTVEGQRGFILERFAECRHCSEKVYYGRSSMNEKWVLIEPKDSFEKTHDMHRCEGQKQTNPVLFKYNEGIAQDA